MATIERCLGSLEHFGPAVETIVVDSSTDGTGDIVSRKFPGVILSPSHRRLFPGDARNRGVSLSHGQILAFLDSDCFVAPDWLDQLLDAHTSAGEAAIGAALHIGNPESLVAWAHYLFEFSAWLPQQKQHELQDIPGGCLSIHRPAFERCGGFAEGAYSEDTALTRRLRADGQRLLFVPSVRVFHIHRERLAPLLEAKTEHGFHYARERARSFSRGVRIAYAAGTPLLPFLLLFRIASRVLSNSGFAGKFVKALPMIALLAAGWSLGELRGYLSQIR